jgi:hypothetical protein
MGSISMHAYTLGMCSPRGEEKVKLAGLDAVLLEGRRTAASSGAEASLNEGRLRTRMMAVVVERSRAYKWTVPEADWRALCIRGCAMAVNFRLPKYGDGQQNVCC